MFLKKFVFKMSEVPHKLKNIYFKNNIRSITKNTYEVNIKLFIIFKMCKKIFR